jgi:hypothetical protein
VSALANVAFTTGALAEVLVASFVALAGVAILLAGLRAVFGWDAKAGLYARQDSHLREIAGELHAALVNIDAGDRGAPERFRRLGARYEAMMLREAADWALVSDREFYEVTP